jgi:hypothetical protein
MKQCNKCNRTYTNDSFNFCLEDGSLLSSINDAEATLIDKEPLGTKEVPTEILNRENNPISINISKGKLFINDHHIHFPVTLDDIEFIFGEPNRRDTKIPTNNIHTWDDLGIYCYENKGSFKINSIGIILNRHFTTTEPSKTFKGKLSVDGAIIDNKSTVSSINRSKSEAPFEIEKASLTNWFLKYENIEIGLYATKQEVVYLLAIKDSHDKFERPKNYF